MSRVALVLAVVAAALGACGGTESAAPELARPVPSAIVPTDLPDNRLTVIPSTSPEVAKGQKQQGLRGLVSDTKLWELHLGQQLVGALQVSTLKRRVDPSQAEDRDAITGQILGVRTQRLTFNGLRVWANGNATATSGATDRAIYVWFGAHTFAVLQLKGADITPPKVAAELIPKIASQPAWEPLPPSAFQ
jgi:hypothetical protein